MVINFTNKKKEKCYISLSELYKGNLKGYLYRKSDSIDKFVFEDHLFFKNKTEVVDYLLKEDSTINLDKFINFRENNGEW